MLKNPPPVYSGSVIEGAIQEYRAGVPDSHGLRKVGDVVNIDGVAGVVSVIGDDGRHGWAVSLEEWTAPWYAGRDIATLPMALEGGRNDAALIRTLPEWEEKFPVFSICYRLGEGSGRWWLPSLEELTLLYGAFNGGPPGTIHPSARAAFNRCLVAAGGKALSDGVYWCSTSPDGRRAYCLDFTSGIIRHYFNYHYDWRCYHRVRAIGAF